MMTADGNGERSSAEARVSAVVKESWLAKWKTNPPLVTLKETTDSTVASERISCLLAGRVVTGSRALPQPDAPSPACRQPPFTP